MKNQSNKILVITLMLISNLVLGQQIASVDSPNKNISVQLNLKEGTLTYQVEYNSIPFIEKSPLGLKTSMSDFVENLTYVASTNSTIRKTYTLKKAKVSHVNYEANALSAKFSNGHKDTLIVHFRVTNSDVAFAYEIISKENKSNIKILNEVSGFNLPNDATTYITPQSLPMTGWRETRPSYEEEYTLNQSVGKPSTYGTGYTFPALFKLSNNNGWILISETGVDSHYPAVHLSEGSKDGLYQIAFPQESENNGIGNSFAVQSLPAKTPWRTITLGASLKPIVESTVAYDLVEEKYKPTVNYKPGRATWSWIVWQDNSINYSDQVKFIDLAKALNFEYVLIDNWWDKTIGREKIEELVKYANSQSVDVLLWYNSNGYWNEAPQTPKNKMNTLIDRQKEMSWLQKIGVKGIKVDFFGGDKQTTIELYEDILTDANKYGLGVTFHGCTLPRGWGKMYPNYITSEAVLASENLVFKQKSLDKHALNASILPFTRNAVGPMDFAPVFLNKRLSKNQETGSVRKTTDAFELATSILYFSPIQHFGLTPNNIDEQPNFVINFLKEVPTVWDETQYIGGEPEDYCAIARRKGKKWYVAIINAKKEKRNLSVNLPMLANKAVSLIHDNKDKMAIIDSIKMNAKGTHHITLMPEGGTIIIGE